MRRILETQRFQTLEIHPRADEHAWRTLLSAMPDFCSIDRLILSGRIDRATAPLVLGTMARMPELKMLHFDCCDCDAELGELSCAALPNLQELCVEQTTNPFPLLNAILKVSVSQPSGFRLISNSGMNEEDHAALAKLLSAQAKAKLHDLRLSGLLAGEGKDKNIHELDGMLTSVLAHYAEFLREKTTRLTNLSLSNNPLGPGACAALQYILQVNDAPMNLSLADCWPRDMGGDDWGAVGELVRLKRLAGINLSGNVFRDSARPLFSALAGNEGLQHLSLATAWMDNQIWEHFSRCLTTMKLPSLELPSKPDPEYRFLTEAMEANDFLHTLHAPGIDQRRSWMTSDQFNAAHPHYLALKASVDRNWQKWDGAAKRLENGMRQVLAHLGHVEGGPLRDVPLDVAHYAAQWAVKMNGPQTRVLSGLNESALPEN
ncbi:MULTISPECIES: hypothetical protein [unclassified Variovorax]|uniref:hypothetical protein n=1 Tax=unclassified Variovorax TaxID=663243 RepID=UPI000A4B8B0F|nr:MULTISPECIES: hypothetical protein [unclassified Variovorax]PNG56562.1 hypothetical protein CHC07_02982 [Variovorax sp. B4]PNG57986.1 hypothetical protein CHC06_02985 [Variovorax sp. B2]VTV09539.1 Ran GTPase-activating protein (RanGAP) involved in mRNA processing and transport [Variovorax sp. WDL1]